MGQKTPQKRVENFGDYKKIFLTTTHTIRKSFVSAALAKQYPDLPQIFLKAKRIQTILTSYNHAIIAEASEALITFADQLFTHYQLLKSQEALLDYDDLIHLTADLFQKPDIAPWVLYKLDGGFNTF